MITNGKYICPACGKAIRPVGAGAIVFGHPFYCRHCRVEWYPNIYNGVELDGDTPFPLTENDN